MKKMSELSSKSKRSLHVAVGILAVFFVVVIVTNFYLYFNYLLGNDVAVKVSVDNESLVLEHGQTDEIELSAKILTNPFCQTACRYRFSDISHNKTIDEKEFKFKYSEPFTKTYNIQAPLKGIGETIYRFEMTCTSNEGALCYSQLKPFSQDLVVVMNYGPNAEDDGIGQRTRESLEKNLENFTYWENFFGELNMSIQNSPLVIEDTEETLEEVMDETDILLSIKSLLEEEEYRTAESLLQKEALLLESLQWKFNLRESETKKTIELFNNLTTDFNEMQNKFALVIFQNYSNETQNSARRAAGSFISERGMFISKGKIEAKENVMNAMHGNLTLLTTLIEEDIATDRAREFSLGMIFNVTEVYPIEISANKTEIKIGLPLKECCVFGVCGECVRNESYYPVIFLHGHDFSSDVSAEYNLNIFGEMQRELEKDGLLNMGTMFVNVPEEVLSDAWAYVPWPMSIKASYYFDAVREEEGLSVLQTKKDNIDTYAIRVRNIVESVKKKTGKDKVILVTHSMGGLVAQRYLQIFGEENVDKLIMVASPNKGITAGTYAYCKAFGELEECEDMLEGSLFMKKLQGYASSVESYNIVGIGCETGGKDGDGVVQRDHSEIVWAKNYLVNGTCEGFDYLHSKIVKPVEYPQTKEILKETLFEQ